MIPRVIPIANLQAIMTALVVDLEQRSFSEPLAQCTVSIAEGIAQNYGAKVDSHGVPWKPRKDTKPHPLLRLSHLMFGSLANMGAPGMIDEVGPREAKHGTDLTVVPYARAQNLGHIYNVKGRTWVLPAREYAYLRDERLGMLDAILGDFAETKIF